MKVTFDKQELLAALVPAASISQTKNTLVSVDGLLFEFPPNPKFGEYDTDKDNLCRISAFDLEKGLRSTVECKIDDPGMCVINTVKILQIIRAMPDGNITLDIDDKYKMKITGGQSSFEIMVSDVENFPTMPMFIGERSYKIPQTRIKRLISETVFAVAQNDQRAAYNGSFFKIKDGYLTAVGCDGNRISAAKCQLSDVNAEVQDAEMLVPGKFLSELLKIVGDTEEELTMIIGRRHIIFKIDNIYFFTRMLDAEYVNYEKILPKTYMTQAYVSKKELLQAMERASIVTEDKLGGSGKSYVKVDFMNNLVSVSSVSQGGSIFEKIPAAIDGEGVSIGFNCRLLLDALHACPAECERLRIRLNNPLMGVVIEPSYGSGFIDAKPNPEIYGERAIDVKDPAGDGGEGDLFMYLVMPRRMNK